MPKVRSKGKSRTGARAITCRQHVVSNPLVIVAILQEAGLKPTDVCLEIGPGNGNLTVELLKIVKKVIVCAIDRRSVAILYKRVKGTPFEKKLYIIDDAALEKGLPFFDICVCSEPHQTDPLLLRKLLYHRPHFRCAVLAFPREVAKRMVAKPGDKVYCRLSINMRFLSTVNVLLKLGRRNFYPPLKEKASIVRIVQKRSLPRLPYEEWDRLTSIAFDTSKNENLATIFSQESLLDELEESFRLRCRLQHKVLPLNFKFEDKLEQILNYVYAEQRRPIDMDVEDFIILLHVFNSQGIHFK